MSMVDSLNLEVVGWVVIRDGAIKRTRTCLNGFCLLLCTGDELVLDNQL